MTFNEIRIGSLYQLLGQQTQSITTAGTGEIVAVSRLEGVNTGDILSDRVVTSKALTRVEKLKPVYALAIAALDRKDEVKLTAAISKLVEEDPSLEWEQHGDTHEVILSGQGEIHLRVALERLKRKYNLPMQTHLPQVPYKETIRQSKTVHGRYKHQSGGHGAFGDVYLDIKPLSRGEGFNFHDTIVGGAVPKQYIPGVEMGVREYIHQGPLGFPVVDIDVTLTNGSYHSVDSSEQAFKQAARIAMTEGMQACEPILLEPILTVTISAPTEFTSKVLQLITTRRGQILGFEPVANWKGWDQITGYLPQGEMQNLIIELRSMTMGVGFFHWEYDHLQEVPEKITANVLASNGH
jgi:elongation factor G